MKKISVIGGINVDITGNPYGQLVPGGENPGKMSLRMSGSGRDIAENLARLGADVKFITKAGNDFAGKYAKMQLEQLGVDVSDVCLDEDENTPTILEIYNIMDGLEMAFGNHDSLEKIDKELLEKPMGELKKSAIVSMDANMTEETLDYITNELKDVPLFLDPANVEKAERVKNIIGRFTIVAPNRAEAEKISGLTILSEEQLIEAGQWFADQGIERVYITMAGGGAYYNEKGRSGIIKPEDVVCVDKQGGGDAFSAAVLDAYVKGMDIEESAKYAMAAAAITVETKNATNENMSQDEIKKRI